MPQVADGQIGTREAPALAALNETLRDDYVRRLPKGVDRWNRTLAEVGLALELPHVGFNRNVGAFAAHRISPDGRLLTDEEWAERVHEWLPTDDDRAHVQSLMRGVTEPGQMASWVAAPATGIHAAPGRLRVRPPLGHERWCTSPRQDAVKCPNASGGRADFAHVGCACRPPTGPTSSGRAAT